MTKPSQVWHVDSLPWQEIGADGTKYALLEGRRDVPGEVFSYAFFIPAGFWDPAHWHTADARIVVLKGTLYLGYGERQIADKLSTFPVGSFVFVPAGASHFDGSDEDTVILGIAVGPWSTHYLDASTTPSTGTI